VASRCVARSTRLCNTRVESSDHERKRVSVHAYECHVSHTASECNYVSCGTHQVQHGNKSRVSDVYMSRQGNRCFHVIAISHISVNDT
jgi:hypothetical protein